MIPVRRPTLLLCLPLLCLLGAARLGGQSLLRQLADEVCECLGTGEIVYPRLQAGRCMENVARAHPRRIQEELRLTVTSAGDRERLSELLIEPLAEHCNALRRLAERAADPEPRYSDIPLLRQRATSPYAKEPPPDGPAATVATPANRRLVSGRLVAIGREEFTVRLPGGERLTLRYNHRQLRRAGPRVGETLSFTYYLDWTAEAGRVVPTLGELR
ncbi:hypothetical protein [Lewinella sp. IMCC34183]|uniref:hypothetical protein n=1 Tax=Lewinella sp. IMCC34183 TaxID=2248762 RepID=UPI0013004EA4|nr:hypothetical protein [Lewinella sp. IMCC34183]